MNKLIFKSILILLVSCSSVSIAQSKLSSEEKLSLKKIADTIDRSILTKEAGWRMKNKKTLGNIAESEWEWGDRQISVTILHYSSVAEATKGLQAAISPSMGKISKENGLGDEGYVWRMSTTKGETCAVKFRKANFLIFISGGELSFGKKFAKIADDSLTENVLQRK